LRGFALALSDKTVDWKALAALLAAAGMALAIALLPLAWSVLFIAGSIVLVLTLVRPQLGVLLIVVAVPFGSLGQVSLGVMNVGITEALVVLSLAAWFMRMVGRREIRIVWPPLTLPLFFFLGALCLSLLGAMSLQYSLKEIVKWVEVLALYVLVANELDDRWSKILCFVLLGTGAMAALQGISQFLFRLGPEEFVLFGRFMRAYGTFEQPNPYAGYLGLTLPLAVGLVLAAMVPMGKRVRGWWLVWAVGCGLLMLTALVMSWSRGAQIGFIGAFAVMVIAVIARSGRGAVLGVALAALLLYVLLFGGLSVVPASVVQRFSDFVPYVGVADVRGMEITDANFAVLERMAHWQSALEMWTDHPWLGVGIGNYALVYEQYALPLWPFALGHAHNYYLNIAAESGVVGVGAYLLLWISALLGAYQATRRASGWYWGIALGILGVLIHLSVHNLFDNLYVHDMYLQLAILLGIGAAYEQQWAKRVEWLPGQARAGGYL
jgi:putative inorganic carbon (HCO3(-)) transporter